ncbi:hypothetical protein [Sphingobacterium psychroaquaticum]|uniref:Uncharacterized protein n=1 Tax=Sphingobacterium psychroaquaticum TaxID=561061 RepID=A0A1X7JMU1_9SPHI|nr:hypothetical protein [Sphingobacterium psychroaquaticum]QBQ40848.1 hypothetical protein E2P86_06655 [Sphingobacterium psychroaquaticum]SMG29269.1 hypothetical protein SAMN05660862_1905 [Sphingobacterium psychroaquaticum]
MNTDSAIAITVHLPDFLFQSIVERPQLLFELFATRQQEDLKAFLFEQLVDKDGAPDFEDFQVHLFRYNNLARKGTFRLKFAIKRQFCCADTESCSFDYLDFDFVYEHERIVAQAHYFNWNLDN